MLVGVTFTHQTDKGKNRSTTKDTNKRHICGLNYLAKYTFGNAFVILIHLI